jgi:hypothetical protein
MDDYSGTLSKSRSELLKDLDAVLVRAIMEFGTEVIDICCNRLRGEEVAACILARVSSLAISLTVP